MADNNDTSATEPSPASEPTASEKATEKVADKQAAAPASEKQAPGEKPARAEKSRAGSFINMFFCLVLVGSLGYTGYMVYEQDKAVNVLFEQYNGLVQARNGNTNLLNTLQESQGTLQQNQSALQNSLASVRQEAAELVAAQAAEIQALQNELVSTRLRINESNPGASQEWLLAEAASLLRLARQHLVVTRNVRTAQALYIAADDVLKQIDDPAIFAVRETLAGELAAIRAVTEVDVSSMYLQLGAVADQVNSLAVTNDLATQIAQGESVSLATEEASGEGMISRFFTRVRNSLNNYFVVRRRDVPIQPLMTPGQEAALMQTIRLQIEQGRTALLKGEQAIYSASLEQARNNIEAYLAGDEGVRNSVLQTLDNLRARRIVTEVPPLNRSLQALDQILSTREPGTPAADGA